MRAITCRCSYGCHRNVSSEEAERIFKAFYNSESYDLQNIYLAGQINVKPVVRTRVRESSRRQHSFEFEYHLRLQNGTSIQVCRKSFCAVHGINPKRVRVLQNKITSGEIVPVDKRGKYTPRPNAIPADVIEKVKQHVESFPRQRSHYSISENLHREYLPENLSIAEMYRLYVEKYQPARRRTLRSTQETPLASEWMYRKIFNEQFNLSFGFPRSDTCEKCDYLKNAAANPEISNEEKDIFIAQLAEHQKLAGEGYLSLKKDTDNSRKPESKALVLTFDMMQNSPVPSMTHSAMYYLRQLYVLVLGIHHTSDDSAYLYAWDESTAGRGPDEIASCLSNHVSARVEDARHLICYSDSCFGQNKNFVMMSLFNTLINEETFSRIDHKFLVRGHTYLPNDRDFGHISKVKKDQYFIRLPTISNFSGTPDRSNRSL